MKCNQNDFTNSRIYIISSESDFALKHSVYNPELELRTPNNQLRTLYSNTFQDHIANPRNAGELADANAVGDETNPVCGDRLRLSIRLKEGRIEAVGFLAYGCAPTLACGSVLTELLEGKTAEEALRLTRKDVVDGVGGLPSRKQHAAALAIETLHAALSSSAS